MRIIYHKLIPKDLGRVLDYYEVEGGTALSERFFQDAEITVTKLANNPERYHIIEEQKGIRRAPLKTFPYHFLFKVKAEGIFVLILRHDKQHPRYGLRRKVD